MKTITTRKKQIRKTVHMWQIVDAVKTIRAFFLAKEFLAFLCIDKQYLHVLNGKFKIFTQTHWTNDDDQSIIMSWRRRRRKKYISIDMTCVDYCYFNCCRKHMFNLYQTNISARMLYHCLLFFFFGEFWESDLRDAQPI